MTKESENKELEIDVTKIVLDVYTKIAIWHNGDFGSDKHKGDALKIVSHDIVQTIIDDIIEQIGVNSRLEVKRGDKVVGTEDSKDKKSFESANPNDTFSKLFTKK